MFNNFISSATRFVYVLLKLFLLRYGYECLLYSIESEILKNTQWDIFHIFTSEDIDHVTFSKIFAFEREISHFLLGTI
jgi:hypothetical protein